MLRLASMALLSVALAVCGCSKPNSPAAQAPVPAATSTPPASTGRTFHLPHAQSGLARVKLFLGPRELQAELCISLPEIATGLMFRPGIGPDESMFFAFASGDSRAFYMKNVDFDIAVAYIDTEGVIQEIVQLKKRDERGIPSKSSNIQFALETAPDWFTRNGIGTGTLVRAEGGSLREAFGRRATLR